jgi:hypothetical protein
MWGRVRDPATATHSRRCSVLRTLCRDAPRRTTEAAQPEVQSAVQSDRLEVWEVLEGPAVQPGASSGETVWQARPAMPVFLDGFRFVHAHRIRSRTVDRSRRRCPKASAPSCARASEGNEPDSSYMLSCGVLTGAPERYSGLISPGFHGWDARISRSSPRSLGQSHQQRRPATRRERPPGRAWSTCMSGYEEQAWDGGANHGWPRGDIAFAVRTSVTSASLRSARTIAWTLVGLRRASRLGSHDNALQCEGRPVPLLRLICRT